ncbi:MAG: selenoneine biosynthesis selenosugar synthase SenB [Thiotrichales bacterium]
MVIVTPYLRAANNGNWQTAWRWRRHLAGTCQARIVAAWPDEQADGDEVMIALHARRSAPSIAAWAAAHPGCCLAVALTGTDLYRDIGNDAAARRSIELAQVLVTLQELGPRVLPETLRDKARVIYQSATSRRALAKPTLLLRAVMVGHLRDEKSPETLFAAARLLAERGDIRIDHIGAGLDPALAEAARATMAAAPGYRWLGGLSHDATRRRIQRAHVLVHASRMEGGAHVIIEAVVSGTPVVAARIDGNVGMLGTDYAGYFPWGDAEALAALLRRGREDAAFLSALTDQCHARAPKFDPQTERFALELVVNDLMAQDFEGNGHLGR